MHTFHIKLFEHQFLSCDVLYVPTEPTISWSTPSDVTLYYHRAAGGGMCISGFANVANPPGLRIKLNL